MTSSQPAFRYTHTVETDVAAAAIWALYEDVSTWPLWDERAQAVTRDGPFAAGTAGTMTFAGQDPLSYRLLTVEREREFTDETPVGDLVVRVSHRLDSDGLRLRVTYAAEVDGPADQAREVGPLITADFPQTKAALIALAAQRSAPSATSPSPAATPGTPSPAATPGAASASSARSA